MRTLSLTKKPAHDLLRSEQGASMVEFAIVLPVLLFLLVGLIEIGRMTYYSILASDAAKAGVQYGAQSLQTAVDRPGMTSAAVSDGQGLANWTSSPGQVNPQCLISISGGALGACPTSGSSGAPTNTVYYVRVTVTGQFKTLLHYPGIPPTVTVSGSATQRVVNQ